MKILVKALIAESTKYTLKETVIISHMQLEMFIQEIVIPKTQKKNTEMGLSYS